MKGITNSAGILLYTIAISHNQGGVVTPNDDFQVMPGSNRVIVITPNNLYRINSVLIDGVDQGPITSYAFENIVSNHTVDVVFESNPIYTITIDPTAVSSSNTGVQITSTSRDVSSRSSREVILKEFVRHYLLPINGFDNAIKLNESNLALDESGNTVTIDGSAGDVMLGIDTFSWKVTLTDASNSKMTIQWCRGVIDGWTTAHMWDNKISPRLYVGVFNGTSITRNGSTCLTSSYNTNGILNTITHDTITQYAWNNGPQYNLMTHISWTAIQILAIFLYGVLNFQDNVAQGYSTGGSGASSLHNNTVNYSLTGGWTQGAVGSNTDCTIMGIKNLYAHQWQFLGGSIFNNGTAYIQYDQSKVMKISSGSTAALSNGWEKIITGTTSLNATYIKTVSGDPIVPFYAKAGSGSSSTYFSDGAWSNLSGDRCCDVGGTCHHGALCGLFAFHVSSVLSVSVWDIGSRLQAISPP